jgi:hypothetical protein
MHTIWRALLGVGLGLVLTNAALAQQAKQALPEGLKHVPVDAMGFVHIRAGDFLKSEMGKSLLTELQKDREASKGLKEMEKTLGVGIGDLESLTILMLAPPKNSLNSPYFMDRMPGYSVPRAMDLMPFDKAIPPPPPPKKETEQSDDGKESPVMMLGGKIKIFPPDVYDMQPRGMANPVEPLIIVTSTKPLDQKKILRTKLFAPKRPAQNPPLKPLNPNLPPDALPVPGPNQEIDIMRGGPASYSVVFLSDHSVLLGYPSDLGRYSDLMGRKAEPKKKPLESGLALGAEPHLVVAGGHLNAEMRSFILSPFNIDGHMLAPFTPLMQTEAGVTLDLDKTLKLSLQFNCPNEANAAQSLQAVKTLRVLAELALEKSQEAGESGGVKKEMEKAVAKSLADAVIERKGTTVRATLKMDVTPAMFKHFAKEIVANFRVQGDRAQSVNNLRQIGIAMHNYHDANKHFPPPGISDINDATGKPLLSWRVAILPYIEQQALYQEFDLTQAWDSPRNKKLIAKMPAIYILPGSEEKEGHTHYRVLVGPGAVFEKGQKIGIQQITDGTSNTIMVVEAADPTVWTKPDDLPFDPNGKLPKFGISPDGFNALFCDGTVRFIRANTPADVIRTMITRNAGDIAPIPD